MKVEELESLLKVDRPSKNLPSAYLNAESPAPKPNGSWPKGTWLQRRLAEVRLQEAIHAKAN